MPFRLPEKKVSSLVLELEYLASQHSPFELELNGFDAFQPRVIFMKVSNSDTLNDLQKSIQTMMKTKLNIFNANYQERPFHPHLTLAFRDLKKDKFEVAWGEFKEKPYQAEFSVQDFYLPKHTGKNWNIHRRFSVLR